jgi:glycosyltransferase involved in cell wall biosynthesis
MHDHPHIVILCSRLDMPGGIERAVVNTANLLASHGHTVTLVILDTTSESYYPIDPLIHVVQQPLSFGITHEGNVISRKIKLLSDVLALRKIIRRYYQGILISSEYPFTVASILAGARKRSSVIAWEHHHHAWLEKNNFWKRLCNLAYPKMDSIVCLNKSEAEHYSKKGRATVIPNFVKVQPLIKLKEDPQTILSIGWLIRRKGIDLIMTMAKEILTRHPRWKWKLIGEGEMKEEVLEFVKNEKLEGRFILQQPAGPDLNDEYLNASIFVLASRHEAFPMVLLEAMSNRLPCVSFDCESGPNEIIRDGEDGLLISKEDTAAMTAAIEKLITDAELRNKMGAAARENIKRFSPENVYQLWSELFAK